jgi:Plasmid pRiA4b ORF-3-like protein
MLDDGAPEFGDALELKVSLRHIVPQIWRKLRVPAELDLEELHEVLQIAFGWSNSHLHSYQVGSFCFRSDFGEQDESFYIDEAAAHLGAVARNGTSFTYEYDFGDGWQHDIAIERVIAGGTLASPSPIECLDGKRSCPPEDCGGPPGYGRLLAVLRNPADPEYSDVKTQAGRGFDAEAFDLEKVNKKLAILAKRLGFGKPTKPRQIRTAKH